MRRQTLEQELRHLQNELLTLGDMVEVAITESVESLKQWDFESIERRTTHTRMINKKRFAIETDALVLIAAQQLTAEERRLLTAVLEMATELERLGDYANSIARFGVTIGLQAQPGSTGKYFYRAERVRESLNQGLRAFEQQDLKLARAAARELSEDRVDGEIRQLLLTFEGYTSYTAGQVNHLQWIAYRLERAADRVSNICSWVAFTITGEMEPANGSS